MSTETMIGHNNPPSDIDIVAENAKRIYGDILARADELVHAEARLPTEIADDETSGKIGDYIKQITANMKALDAARVGEKEPHLAKGRAVDGFFKRYTERLKSIKDRVSIEHGRYIKAKEDREREAERKRKEEEAERLRQEAAEKLRQAEEEKRKADEAREAAEAETKRIADEAAAEKKRIADEAEQQRKAQQDEIDRLKKEQEDFRLKSEADDKETKRLLKEAEDKLKSINKEEKTELKSVATAVKEAEKNIADINKSAKISERESERALESAAKIDKQADRMEMGAVASQQKTVRVRGDQGSVSSVRHEWKGSLADIHVLDLEALRHHIPVDALNQAIQSFVDTGKYELAGAYIREEIRSTVR